MKGKEYQLQIDHHPSGNRTLKQREVGASMWADLQGKGLFANGDTGSFYQAVAHYVVQLSGEGHRIVSLVDTSETA